MLVKELIAELQKHDPDAEVGIGNDYTHYVSKIKKVRLEERTVCVPKGAPVVFIEMADEAYVPGDEEDGA